MVVVATAATAPEEETEKGAEEGEERWGEAAAGGECV